MKHTVVVMAFVLSLLNYAHANCYNTNLTEWDTKFGSAPVSKTTCIYQVGGSWQRCGGCQSGHCGRWDELWPDKLATAIRYHCSCVKPGLWDYCSCVEAGIWFEPSEAVWCEIEPCECDVKLPCRGPADNCNFYRDCVEEKVECGATGYAIAYGDKFCNKYQDNQYKLSVEGRLWKDQVLLCLQNGLNQILNNDKLTCDEIEKYAFDSHPGCYAPDKGYSICGLPQDWLAITGITKEGLTSLQGVRQVWKTLERCPTYAVNYGKQLIKLAVDSILEETFAALQSQFSKVLKISEEHFVFVDPNTLGLFGDDEIPALTFANELAAYIQYNGTSFMPPLHNATITHSA